MRKIPEPENKTDFSSFLPEEIGKVSNKVMLTNFKFKSENVAKAKKNEYIKVRDDTGKWILAQITNIVRKSGKKDEVEASAEIIGYRNDKGTLVMPRTPLKPGKSVHLADEILIKNILNLKSNKAGLYLGLLDGHESLMVYVDTNTLITKHLSVLAMSGSGKSYAVGVLLEELAEKNIPVVVVDTHGEYGSLCRENSKPEEIDLMSKYGISAKGFENVNEFNIGIGRKNRLVLNGKNLSVNEIAAIAPVKITNSQQGILYEIIDRLKQGNRDYTLFDIVKEIELYDGNSNKWALLSALKDIETNDLFGPIPTSLNDIIKPGTVSVINLRGINVNVQQVITAKIVQDLFMARKNNFIVPFFMVIEEAHNFAPERSFGGEVVSSQILRNVASEGRKFGLGLCMVTQRPARLDKNVLSQCNSQIILKLSNPNDITAVANSIESFTENMKDDLKSLPVGNAIVTGAAVDRTLIVDIRTRKSLHGGASVNIEDEIEKSELAIEKFNNEEETVVEDEIFIVAPYKKTYYMTPVWIMGDKKGKCIVIDGRNGKIKFKDQEIDLNILNGLSREATRVLGHMMCVAEANDEALAEDLDLGKVYVKRAIKELQERNFVKVEPLGHLENYKPNLIAYSTIAVKKEDSKNFKLKKNIVDISDINNIGQNLFGENVQIIKAYKSDL